jgi:hypothetical protein
MRGAVVATEHRRYLVAWWRIAGASQRAAKSGDFDQVVGEFFAGGRLLSFITVEPSGHRAVGVFRID